ncbi:mucin 5ac, oligomeric mucus/gel-forming [Plakobranchus ocellatus]|uniref:Mucin 5ac, oligomeric mucus/gel-forming n=1 Tax=Plakobranchus ocellatus TaxID=259542 RepID=A0AAV3XX41_9GAST|nr:mucin 5ac, oligomeric mucus/gel-forming [Plakobranchus ocellatus]
MGTVDRHLVRDSQITASSEMDEDHAAPKGRLHNTASWVPNVSDNDQNIQVDFLAPYEISGVVTQGRSDTEAWVTKYAVYYSTDGISFHPVLGADNKPIVFSGNSDQFTPVKNFFPGPEIARFVQIRPLGFHKSVGLRFDLYGCDTPSPLPPTFAQGTPTPAPPLPSGGTPSTRGCQFWSPWVSNSVPDQYAGELEMFFQTPMVTSACTQDFVIG